MSSVKIDVAFARVDVRSMHELDIPVVAAIEKAAYQFPWSEGIFRDCLRVGYVCRIIDVAGDVGGYGIMSVGAGEAHILNVCVRDEYRSRGFARKMMLYLHGTRAQRGNERGVSRGQTVECRGRAFVSFVGFRAGRHTARLLPGRGGP